MNNRLVFTPFMITVHDEIAQFHTMSMVFMVPTRTVKLVLIVASHYYTGREGEGREGRREGESYPMI